MLTIHGIPISVHTRKVIVTATEKRLDYANEPVIPFNPPAGWERLSPTGKIPVVTEGDFTLADSSAICAWLERMHPDHPVYPIETNDYARALWFEEYADGTVFPAVVHVLFFQNVIRPKILKQDTDLAAVEAVLTQALPKVFGYLEGNVGGGYLAGGQFTIADIALTSNLINFHYLGYRIDRQQHPKLAAWFARLCRHPAIAAALAKEEQVANGMGLDRSFLHKLAA